MNIIGSKYIKYFYILIALYGMIILAVVTYLQYSGNRIATVYVPLIDAAMEIKLEITQSRLKYQDTYLADDPNYLVSIGEIDRHIHNAKWYIDAMLSGGINTAGEFVSIDNAKLRIKIHDVKQVLLALDRKLHGAMLEQDNVIYNDRFNQQLVKTHFIIMREVDLVKGILHNSLTEEKNNIIRINGLVIILLTGALIFLLYIRLHKEGRKSISELHQLTMLDGLTGIYNRRYLDENINLLWKQLARADSSLSLIMCDIDYFKKYNDAFGHIQGDICLSNVAKLIESALVREIDFVARYGGEEFCVVLPGTGNNGAMKVMQNIHNLLELENISHPTSEVSENVTLSAGIATIHSVSSSNDISELMRFADQALYCAKQNGRNQTFSHSVNMYSSYMVGYAG